MKILKAALVLPPSMFRRKLTNCVGTERSQENAKDLSTAINDLFERQARVRVSEISKRTKVSRNTITNALNRLIGEGKITRHGYGAGVYYTRT